MHPLEGKWLIETAADSMFQSYLTLATSSSETKDGSERHEMKCTYHCVAKFLPQPLLLHGNLTLEDAKLVADKDKQAVEKQIYAGTIDGGKKIRLIYEPLKPDTFVLETEMQCQPGQWETKIYIKSK
jgi:hypothetical protein